MFSSKYQLSHVQKNKIPHIYFNNSYLSRSNSPPRLDLYHREGGNDINTLVNDHSVHKFHSTDIQPLFHFSPIFESSLIQSLHTFTTLFRQ